MQQSKITEEPMKITSLVPVKLGAIFNLWTVLSENPHKRHGKVLCRCSCGTEREVFVHNLLSGRSTSCGCGSQESRDTVKPGAVFGKWTVLGENPHTRHGMVLCRCTCGVEKMVFVSNLLKGLSKSCGCTPQFAPGMMQGRLYVIGYPWLDSLGRKRVKCYCECSRTYFPRTDDLYHGQIHSCRCFHFRSEYRLRMKETAIASQRGVSY
ncbi:MAG: hypothetical protein KAR40_17260 [Candidatus Sabulitectum sp.]|nr:hypothetical protein [Candidatus Sabulitectum sp.]